MKRVRKEKTAKQGIWASMLIPSEPMAGIVMEYGFSPGCRHKW
jgi:hypothetical protein